LVYCAAMRNEGEQPVKGRSYWIGAACGIFAAICYGTNPLGAMALYKAGFATGTVLVYRFGFAAIALATYMLAARIPFLPDRKASLTTAALGALFAVSSLTLYESFRLMDVGVASTMLFVYPVMTAAIMTLMFGERLTARTIGSIALAFGGIALLSLGGGEHRVSAFGTVLVLLSALSYTIYIIVVDKAKVKLPLVALTFWAITSCCVCVALWTAAKDGPGVFRLPGSATEWGWALFLAFVPSLTSLGLMAVSARRLGSTPTAIMGALEPATAVAIGVGVFGEAFTLRLVLGMAAIVAAVVLTLAKRQPKISR